MFMNEEQVNEFVTKSMITPDFLVSISLDENGKVTHPEVFQEFLHRLSVTLHALFDTGLPLFGGTLISQANKDIIDAIIGYGHTYSCTEEGSDRLRLDIHKHLKDEQVAFKLLDQLKNS